MDYEDMSFMQKLKRKHSLKTGAIICIVGICIIGFGAISREYWTVRMAGVIITGAGLITIGKRVYERIQEKRKNHN